MAVFKSVGALLVDEESWPIRQREDEQLPAFLSLHATPGHIEILRREVDDGVRRIWPDEVIGACTVASPPVVYEDAREAANGVMAMLEGGSLVSL